MADESIFPGKNFSDVAVPNDSCKERVECSNQIRELKENTLAAKTDISTSYNFEINFPEKPEHDRQRPNDSGGEKPSVQ